MEVIQKMNENKSKVMYELLSPLKAVFANINASFKKNVKEIGIILKCLYVAIMVLYCNSFVTAIVTTLILMFISSIVKVSYCKANNITVNGFPTRERRYTSVDKDGFITVNENDKFEMIQYMFEIENYLETHKSA